MAIATSAAVMGGAALLGSGLQIAQGMKDKKQGEAASNALERQELTNVYDDISISLLGSDMRREDNSLATANLTQAARGSGIRGVLSALPSIQESNNRAARQNQLDVDNQVMKRDYARAGDEKRIQGVQENRDNAELAGIGQQINVGRQNIQTGIQGAFNGIAMIGSGTKGNIEGGGQNMPQASEVNTLSSNPLQMSAPAPVVTSGVIPNSEFGQTDLISNYMRTQEERRLYSEAAPKQFG